MEPQLTSWLDKGDSLIIFIDANEDLLHANMKSMFIRLHIHDVIQQRTTIKGPATWYQDKTKIDGVFTSQGLRYSKARFLTFWTDIGDHRAMVLDNPHQVLYGEQKLHIAQPLSRRLQCSKKKCLRKYIPLLKRYFKMHRIDKK